MLFYIHVRQLCEPLGKLRPTSKLYSHSSFDPNVNFTLLFIVLQTYRNRYCSLKTSIHCTKSKSYAALVLAFAEGFRFWPEHFLLFG